MLLFYRVVKKSQLRLVSYAPRKKTHYEVLEIEPAATEHDVREAFIRKSSQLHPDGQSFQQSEKGTEKFMELKEAFDVLRRAEKRAEYDRELSFGREAAKEMFYQTDGHKGPTVLDLGISTPRSRLRPLQTRTSLAARVGHFFDPRKAIAFEEIERRRVIWFFVLVGVLLAGDFVYVRLLRRKELKTV